MTLLAPETPLRQPLVKHLGFEEGWCHFESHFLNLGFPSLLIDECLLPPSIVDDLPCFSDVPPADVWPAAHLDLEIAGDGVRLYERGEAVLTASHWFRSKALTFGRPVEGRVGIFIGSSHGVEMCWTWLWRCRVGLVAVRQAGSDH